MPNAQEIALKYMTPRYHRLDKLEQYWDGTQYDSLVPFFSQDETAPPLLERAPCIVYGLGKNAIRDLVDFMMGHGRYPHISATTTEDDRDLADEDGVSDDEADLLEKWINGPLTESAVLKHEFPESLRMAMRGSSVAIVGCVRQGYPKLEAIPAKWCTPTFDPVSRKVVALEVKYPYIVEEKNPISHKWEEVCYLYRRIIDAQWDVVFLPAKGREDGIEPAWSADPAQTVQHNLGFCPVHWYAFERGVPTAANFDGQGFYQHLLDEMDALNFSLSQRHRAAIYSGDPLIYETGVEEGTMPAPMGRSARVEIEAQAAGPNGKPIGVFTANPMRMGRATVRRKGPGVVWRYPEATSKIDMLTLPEGSLGAIQENGDDIRKKILEDLSVVVVDMHEAKSFGALSGKALAFVFARQVARSDSIRLDVQTNLIFPCLDLLLRICVTAGRIPNQEMRVFGFKKILPILQKFTKDTDLADLSESGELTMSRTTEWHGPRLRLEWGRYFDMAAEEENFIVTLCVAALGAGLMPLENVIEKLRDVFPFSSVDEIVKKLEDAKQESMKQQLSLQEEQAKISSKYDTRKSDQTPPAQKGNANGSKGSSSGAKGDAKA